MKKYSELSNLAKNFIFEAFDRNHLKTIQKEATTEELVGDKKLEQHDGKIEELAENEAVEIDVVPKICSYISNHIRFCSLIQRIFELICPHINVCMIDEHLFGVFDFVVVATLTCCGYFWRSI